MATRSYKSSWGLRLVNGVFRRLARRGKGKETLYVLNVPGRRTGRPREIPLHVISHGSHRYIVAIYGERDWVRNVRANQSRATISRAAKTQDIRLSHTDPDEAGAVLEEYVALIPRVRPYLDVQENPSREDWGRLASTHPVFRVDSA